MKTTPWSARALLAVVLPAMPLAAACHDGPQAPGGGAAAISLEFSMQSSGVAEAYDAVDRIRLTFAANGAVRLQRELGFDPAGAETRIPVDVPLLEDVETLTLEVELRRERDPVFRGAAPVVLTSGAATPVGITLEPVPFQVVCSGPEIVLDAVGASATIEADVLFVTGDVIPAANIDWSTANPNVATVAAGVVTAGSDGETLVTCRAGNLSDTRAVQVFARVASVEVSPSPTDVRIGGTQALTATLRDPGGTPVTGQRPLVWSSSNAQLATVDGSGLVTGLGTGTVQITATSGQVSGSAQVTVRPPSPTVTTLAATDISGSEATLRGSVNPNGSATQAWFEWGTDPQLSGAQSTAPQSVGAGASAQSVSRVLSNLVPGRTYYFRVAASNSFGTERGQILSFETVPVPVVEVLPADVDGLNAWLNAEVQSSGLPTEVWFEWGTDEQLLAADATGRVGIGSGTAAVLVQDELADLTPATVYYFRAHAENAAGITVSPVLSFEIPGPGPPVVETTGAILRDGDDGLELAVTGRVDPRGSETRIFLEVWEDSLGSFLRTSETTILPAGYGFQSVSLLREFLNPSSGVYYRIVAENQYGRTDGPILFAPVPSMGAAATGLDLVTGARASPTAVPWPAPEPAGRTVAHIVR